jgi:RNA polymerase sigma-70 factor (ECF subfamily)
VQPLPLDVTASEDEPGRSVERLSMIAALQVLPPMERAAVVLRFYHDYDYATIARCLNTSTGTVGSWLSRAMDRLRFGLGRSGEVGAVPRASEDRDVS